MADAGVELMAGLDRLAVMGLLEVVRRLPFLLRLRRRVRRSLARRELDLFLPIDYPGFNLPVAEHAHRHGVPVLYYIAPQVWAWREARARRLARVCDRICAVLPFEEERLAPYGADVRFVGHPLLDEMPEDVRGGPEAASEGPAGSAGPRRPVLALFPGSREQEVRRILPPFLGAARLLGRTRPEMEVRIARAPGLAASAYDEAAGAGEGDPSGRERDPAPRSLLVPPERAIRGATAALCKSGTSTLQLALAGVPMVVGYRMHPLTFRVARHLVRVDHVALVNLVAGKRLVPELLQDELTPERLVDRVRPLLEVGGAERRRMLEGLQEVRAKLGEPGCARRVAREAVRLLEAEGGA